jgi:hypothetical protein
MPHYAISQYFISAHCFIVHIVIQVTRFCYATYRLYHYWCLPSCTPLPTFLHSLLHQRRLITSYFLDNNLIISLLLYLRASRNSHQLDLYIPPTQNPESVCLMHCADLSWGCDASICLIDIIILHRADYRYFLSPIGCIATFLSSMISRIIHDKP